MLKFPFQKFKRSRGVLAIVSLLLLAFVILTLSEITQHPPESILVPKAGQLDEILDNSMVHKNANLNNDFDTVDDDLKKESEQEVRIPLRYNGHVVEIYNSTSPSSRLNLPTDNYFSASTPSKKGGMIKDPIMQAADDDNEMRKRRVERLCRQHHLGKFNRGDGTNDLSLKEPPTPLYAYFFWSKAWGLGWCPVYKAGSTSWLHNMLLLAGKSEKDLRHPKQQLSIWAREIYGDEEPQEFEVSNRFAKMLVVRHPFDRLVSAYRDKLSNSTFGHEQGTHPFYLKYGKKIVSKFRTDHSITQLEPTWQEFVAYLLSTDLLHYADDHWLPMYYSCTPCLLQYDFIAKVESYSRDQRFIIQSLHLDSVIKAPRWSHKKTEKSSSAENYFGKLSKSQIYKLYKKYRLDFDLFDYDYKGYIGFGVDDS